MARRSLGDDVKARVKRLFEALLAYVNNEFQDGERLGIKVNSKTETQLIIRTNLRFLAELTQKDLHEGQLTREQVRQSLKRMEDFLEILEDLREHNRGSEDWHFKLKLWHKDKEANLIQFEQEWNNRRPTKSKAAAKKTVAVEKKAESPPPTSYQYISQDEVTHVLLFDNFFKLLNLGFDFEKLAEFIDVYIGTNEDISISDYKSQLILKKAILHQTQGNIKNAKHTLDVYESISETKHSNLSYLICKGKLISQLSNSAEALEQYVNFISALDILKNSKVKNELLPFYWRLGVLWQGQDKMKASEYFLLHRESCENGNYQVANNYQCLAFSKISSLFMEAGEE
jgi:tetratricopeptide (TPR) repeat protein